MELPQQSLSGILTAVVKHLFLCKTSVSCITNVSNMFLDQYWRLETSSRPFYNFIKTTLCLLVTLLHLKKKPFWQLLLRTERQTFRKSQFDSCMFL